MEPPPDAGRCAAGSESTIAPTFRSRRTPEETGFSIPGNGWVSRLCHDPRVAVDVLNQMLAPYLLSGRLRVMKPCAPLAASTERDRVSAVLVRDLEFGHESVIEAPYFIDATPYGQLLELADVEHVLGAESRSDTREPHAPEQTDRGAQQAITVCFALEHLPGEDHTIGKPQQHDFWRDFRPPGWPGHC